MPANRGEAQKAFLRSSTPAAGCPKQHRPRRRIRGSCRAESIGRRGTAAIEGSTALEDMLARAWGTLVGWVHGPTTSRLILQPTVAVMLASIRAIGEGSSMRAPRRSGSCVGSIRERQ